MRLPPKEVLATWPKPNYINPETRGPALIIVELTVLPLTLLCLALRLWVRVAVLKTSGWDDWLMVAAAVWGSGVTVCVILASTMFGWDVHIWDLRLEDMASGRQVSIAAQALFVLATSCAKVSILLSYLRFAPLDSIFRKAARVSIGLIVLVNSIFFVVLWTQCNPTSSYWNPLRMSIDCIPEGPPLLAQAVFTALADFAVWVLPLPTLFQARLPVAQRAALIVLFSCGAFVVFAACMRLYWIYYVIEVTYDVTWEGFHLWIWTAVEVNLGVMCGCIPTLKALVKSYHGGTTQGSRKSKSKSGGSRPVVVGTGGGGARGSVGVVGGVGVGGGVGSVGDKKAAHSADVRTHARSGSHPDDDDDNDNDMVRQHHDSYEMKSRRLGEGEGKQMGKTTDQYMDLESCCSDLTTTTTEQPRHG